MTFLDFMGIFAGFMVLGCIFIVTLWWRVTKYHNRVYGIIENEYYLHITNDELVTQCWWDKKPVSEAAYLVKQAWLQGVNN